MKLRLSINPIQACSKLALPSAVMNKAPTTQHSNSFGTGSGMKACLEIIIEILESLRTTMSRILRLLVS